MVIVVVVGEYFYLVGVGVLIEYWWIDVELGMVVRFSCWCVILYVGFGGGCYIYGEFVVVCEGFWVNVEVWSC